MATPANSSASCPVCSKSCKLSKLGKLSTHGAGGGRRHNHCPGSSRTLANAVHVAEGIFRAQAAELTAKGGPARVEKATRLLARAEVLHTAAPGRNASNDLSTVFDTLLGVE